MTQPAAITGSFADFRNVKTRSVMQLIIEVPIESASNALEVLGYPLPGQELPVAIARLQEAPKVAAIVPNAPKEPRKWSEMSYAQRAGIKCADGLFHEFLSLEYPDFCNEITDLEQKAAEIIRQLCMVKSRSEIDASQFAKDVYDNIEKQFHLWLKYEKTEATW